MLNDVYLVSVEGDAASNPGNTTYAIQCRQLRVGEQRAGIGDCSGFRVSRAIQERRSSRAATGHRRRHSSRTRQLSFLVIYSKTTPITTNTDLDPSNNGTPSIARRARCARWCGLDDRNDRRHRLRDAVLPTLLVGGGTTPSAATRDPGNSTALGPPPHGSPASPSRGILTMSPVPRSTRPPVNHAHTEGGQLDGRRP